ncbi:hypothetical protein [Flavobacterium aestuarii]|uniref:hypothetical protein n=1 Tax=Flavobacterium aestuarii TaxID=3149227 RepID=UPI0032B40254
MKFNTTLNLLKDFFSKNIKENNSFWSSFFKRNSWFIPLEISQAVKHKSLRSFLKAFFNITQEVKTSKIKGRPPKSYYTLHISIY